MYVPSNLYFFLELQHSVIPLYAHHNSTDVPHVYIPITKIETFVILWYLSRTYKYIQTNHHNACNHAGIYVYILYAADQANDNCILEKACSITTKMLNT